jgi:hypothetical protein
MSAAQPATVDSTGQGKKSPREILLGAALRYAKLGWAVFPVYTPMGGQCPCPKPDCTALDSLTVNSFASGFVDARPGAGKQPDLLPLLNGKCLVLKDLTTLFSLRDDAVKKVLGACSPSMMVSTPRRQGP